MHLDKNIKLLDSPGIVFAAAENDAAAVLRNCVKIEKLADPVAPIAEILKRVPAKTLMQVRLSSCHPACWVAESAREAEVSIHVLTQLYKIAGFGGSADQFLMHVAHARGKLRKGGTPDLPSAAKVVLQVGRLPSAFKRYRLDPLR